MNRIYKIQIDADHNFKAIVQRNNAVHTYQPTIPSRKRLQKILNYRINAGYRVYVTCMAHNVGLEVWPYEKIDDESPD